MEMSSDNPVFKGDHIILCKQRVSYCTGYKLQDSGIRGAAGVASVRTGERLPFAGHSLVQPAPQQTRTARDTAKPISQVVALL